MNPVQTKMHENIMIAMDQIKKLSAQEMDLVESHLSRIITLKNQMEAIAINKGYSQACRASIPICNGDCCKWHFPQKLNHIDFFIAIVHMSEDQQIKLAQQVFNNKKNQCPVLLKTGCFLSFEQRPILCTNAYPCFNGRSYWVEKEKKNTLFKIEIDSINAILKKLNQA